MMNLGRYQADVNAALAQLAQDRIVARVWDHDYTVWNPEPTEIINRLGWLHLMENMRVHLPAIQALFEGVKAEGYTHVLLLGMGGSSLAPEVFSLVFGDPAKGLTLSILDSTDPDAVLAKAAAHDLRKTLFIVATKSGGTVETLSFFKYFYNEVLAAVGADDVGQHFVAITDPGSKLAALAGDYRFRQTFINDPNVGGRFAALSLFGLVPAGLAGLDLARLLDSSAGMAAACRNETAAENPGVVLGTVLGVLAKAGRDKLTIILSPEIECLGDWIEQLVAESTGKGGAGILPVVGESCAAPAVYGDDRLFVAITLNGDERFADQLAALEAAGHPVVRLNMADRYDIGAQFFLWEFATSVACHLMGINTFDQPDVEAAKVLARNAVAAYQETGSLPQVDAVAPAAAALHAFLAQGQPGDYIAVQAYVMPDEATTALLQDLRHKLRDQYRLAVTVGYGPRFLHSTGQLHKGDNGNGLFIQFVSTHAADTGIPDSAGEPAAALTFGTLEMAQANGDYGALVDGQRRVIRFDLGTDVSAGLGQLL